jgi:photosystem I subunit VIII
MNGAYAASFLPVILVPLVGVVLPALAMGLLFTYIESEA